MHAFDRQTDRQTDGQTDRQTDGQKSHRKTASAFHAARTHKTFFSPDKLHLVAKTKTENNIKLTNLTK